MCHDIGAKIGPFSGDNAKKRPLSPWIPADPDLRTAAGLNFFTGIWISGASFLGHFWVIFAGTLFLYRRNRFG
jgi:hypothetical protein